MLRSAKEVLTIETLCNYSVSITGDIKMKVEERMKDLHCETALELNRMMFLINSLYNDASNWSDVGSMSKVLEDVRNINHFLAGE